MNPTLWITGAAGFTGQHLIEHLNNQSDKPRIVGLDCTEQNIKGLDAFYQIDLNQLDEITEIARSDSPSWVIHLAAVMPPAEEADMWHINVGCTVNLFIGLSSAGLCDTRIVCIGSAAEYRPQPTGPLTESSPCGGSSLYGRVKWAQSTLAIGLGKALGLSTIVVRPFNLIGPGLSENLVTGWICRQFAQPDIKEIAIGNLDSARDFVDIRDAVAAYWLAAQKGKPAEVYNVCTSIPITVKQLLDLLSEVAGKSPKIRVDPQRVRKADVSICYGDYSKIEQETGWRPRIPLNDSLTAMLEKAQQTAKQST
ncbi:MAG: NAD-dependent epimerase/dehydratase family protein [Planctomycetota bacterium]|jgi:GDP-4-dehydro-6-deoxy-D-mannose reductase